MTTHDLVTDLGRAYREGRLDRRMRVYLVPKFLIIDEMGCPPLDEMGATVFFQLVSARYERGWLPVNLFPPRISRPSGLPYPLVGIKPYEN
jgi:DNA replication protein DnaC